MQQTNRLKTPNLLTCQLSNCTICQGGDYIFWGDSYYVELVFRRGRFCALVNHLLLCAFTSYHQAFHPGFAVVDSLDVGAQVVHAVEASATFVTQERFFSWKRDKVDTHMMRKASPFCKWLINMRLPVWMIMCFDKSPKLTNALPHMWHLCGRTLSWCRMWLASWLDCTNLHRASHVLCVFKSQFNFSSSF